ncbi:hypothetical protein, conserved [Leishmania lindenbergi]|uniref:Nuclear pore complex protein n=1 Tax=Leishmania lindenbergi TaxID=651832 RepID=A0AAW3A127_9TRYP
MSSEPGLTRYFNGLAAGDEMAELIRGLHSSIWRCYQDCLQRPVAVQVPASSVSASGAGGGVGAFANESAELSSRSNDVPLRGSSLGNAGTRFTSPANQSDGAEAVLPIAAPAKPTPIPRGRLKAALRRQYWAATKAAMLFAVESPSVAEEATALHCSNIARSLLYNYYYPSDNRDIASSSPHVRATLGIAPVISTLQQGEVRWVLSDTRIVELARKELKANRVDGAVCGWQRALALLRQVDPTPLTSAVELELYRRTDGHHWAEALGCLWRIKPAHWTEMDVAAAVRCLYSAGRRRHQESSVSMSPDGAEGATTEGGESTSPASNTVFVARLTAQALRIHHAVETAGVLRWSTSSTFNDTLGLIAFGTAGWQDACVLLDKLLASAAAGARSRDPDLKRDAARGVVGTSRGEKAVRSEQHRTGGEAAADDESFLASTSDESKFMSQGEDTSVIAYSQQRAPSPVSLYHFARANAVTVHQTCRAFRSRWDVGLRYVQLLQEAFADTLNLSSDTAATEDVLRLCIAGQQWEAALRLVTAHKAAMADGAEGERLPAVVQDGSSIAAALKGHAAAVVAAPKRATLSQHRRHYRPDVFVQLVSLLGSVQASRWAAYDLIHRYAASGAALSTVAVNLDRRNSTTVGLRLSKHYNTNTLSRAYNCLVQNADTLDAAQQVLEQVRCFQSPAREGSSAVTQDKKSCPGGNADRQLRDLDAELVGLETESVAHITYLSAVAGDWCRALHHANALLHEPRYRATFFPTARLHDAVQYALEQASSPGPSWQVSLQLFTEMMERNVPISEVSFQSAVKRCFSGRVPDQAQKLFYFVLRKGVRP